MSALDVYSAWIDRTPPFSWVSTFNRWGARHFVEPWLNPILRPFKRREARRRIAALLELRTIVASSPASVERIDDTIAIWARRLVEIEAA